MMTTKTALITGATSGIGRAIAKTLAKNGLNVIITGRRKERLETLFDEIKKESQVEVSQLCFDVRDYSAVKASLAGIPGNLKVDILINNAGLALGLAPIHEGDVSQWEQMIDTNIKGLLYMTRELSPQMVARGSGHIINIGSLAGKETYPNGNVYSATKHAVEVLNKAIRLDLYMHNIKVTNVNPGLTETEFSLVRFKGDEKRAAGIYKGYQALKAEDVAEAVWFAVSRPAHVNINDILLTPTAQGCSTMVNKKAD